MSHVNEIIHLLKTRSKVSIKDFAEYDPTILLELHARIANARKLLAKEGLRIVSVEHDKSKGQTAKDNYWKLEKLEKLESIEYVADEQGQYSFA